VVVAGGIDLSVGSILALTGVTMVRLHAEAGMAMTPAALLGLGLGALAGAVNGGLIALAAIPDLVVTLSTMAVYRGLAQAVAGNRVHSNLPEGYRYLGEGFLPGGIPVQWAALAGAWALAALILHRSVLGRRVFALGASGRAARLSRVPPARTRIVLYALSGLAAAAAAIVYTARSNTAKSDDGLGLELDALACVVVGGASLSGGRGSAAGVLLGILVLGLLRTGLVLSGIPELYQRMATGAILIAVAALNERFLGRQGGIAARG
jgi:ribose/xylose/arabinose/galactoside ABC-type transport system permease subunit